MGWLIAKLVRHSPLDVASTDHLSIGGSRFVVILSPVGMSLYGETPEVLIAMPDRGPETRSDS